MQDLMVCCDELHGEELLKHRSCGSSSSRLIDLTSDPPVPTHEPASHSKGAEIAAAQDLQLDTNSSSALDTYAEALQWATGVKDEGILSGMAAALPHGVLQEQLQKFEDSKSQIVPAQEGKPKVTLHMNLAVATKAVQQFDQHLKVIGIHGAQRLPRNCIAHFIRDMCIVPKTNKNPQRWLRRQHDIWSKKGKPVNSKHIHGVKMKGCLQKVSFDRRLRSCGMQGAPKQMPIVRQALYDWFISLRYAIDWREHDRQMKAQEQKKCVGRFPVSLLKQKYAQFVEDYCVDNLIAGQRPRVPKFTWKWLMRWMNEFGLSLRKPNRRYKVPKRIIEERLEIWWINLHRLRALAVECLGYDLEMENFDQSPFHNNETGAQDKPSLSLTGSCSVPLVEGRHDVLERWTGQFTTWSNADRVMAEGPPYCELMFKGSPDGPMLLKLREACRSGGFGPWLTIATQWKGSYREADILNFLEKHLPPITGDRHWRIMMADDFGPHKSENVFNLCWKRGYVMVVHGGGATPISQTPDTDLNQHVRREYSAKESAELIHLMRSGQVVPCPSKETCISMMREVLCKKQLHVQASKGYKYTGATIALDGTEDHMVCREAGEFFRNLNMRPKLNAAMDIVRAEVKAGRLSWIKADVKRLIKPYPKRKEYDDVIDKLGEDFFMGDDDKGYLSEDDEAAVAAEDAEERDEHASDEETFEKTAQEGDDVPAADSTSSHVDTLAVPTAAGARALTSSEAEMLHKSQALIDSYQQAIKELKSFGAMSAAQSLENELRKEKKRQRAICNDHPAVADAMLRRRDQERVQELQEQRAAAELNAKRVSAASLQKQVADAKELLKKRKAQVLEAENLLEMKHAFKTFSPEMLGNGHAKGAGALGRKRRHEVLDRMSHTGTGLSAGQKNSWDWFKDSWDEAMLSEHEAEWGAVFAEYIQGVLERLDKGTTNAFSLFVQDESKRVLGMAPALLVIP